MKFESVEKVGDYNYPAGDELTDVDIEKIHDILSSFVVGQGVYIYHKDKIKKGDYWMRVEKLVIGDNDYVKFEDLSNVKERTVSGDLKDWWSGVVKS